MTSWMRNITTRAELHHEAFSWRLTPYHARTARSPFHPYINGRTSVNTFATFRPQLPQRGVVHNYSMGIDMVEDDHRRRGEKLVLGENSCPRAYRQAARVWLRFSPRVAFSCLQGHVGCV